MNKEFKIKFWDCEGIAITNIKAKNINELKNKIKTLFNKFD